MAGLLELLSLYLYHADLQVSYSVTTPFHILVYLSKINDRKAFFVLNCLYNIVRKLIYLKINGSQFTGFFRHGDALNKHVWMFFQEKRTFKYYHILAHCSKHFNNGLTKFLKVVHKIIIQEGIRISKIGNDLTITNLHFAPHILIYSC